MSLPVTQGLEVNNFLGSFKPSSFYNLPGDHWAASDPGCHHQTWPWIMFLVCSETNLITVDLSWLILTPISRLSCSHSGWGKGPSSCQAPPLPRAPGPCSFPTVWAQPSPAPELSGLQQDFAAPHEAVLLSANGMWNNECWEYSPMEAHLIFSQVLKCNSLSAIMFCLYINCSLLCNYKERVLKVVKTETFMLWQ